METVGVALVMGFVAIIAVVWLIVFPFRLIRGLCHKWGVHSYCDLTCENYQTSRSIKEAVNESFKKGMREGIRAHGTFGAEQSKKFLDDLSLLPSVRAQFADNTNDRAAARYAQLELLMDIEDEATPWALALSMALGELISRFPDETKEQVWASQTSLIRAYARLDEPAISAD